MKLLEMTCPNCGAPIDSREARPVCSRCGTKYLIDDGTVYVRCDPESAKTAGYMFELGRRMAQRETDARDDAFRQTAVPESAPPAGRPLMSVVENDDAPASGQSRPLPPGRGKFFLKILGVVFGFAFLAELFENSPGAKIIVMIAFLIVNTAVCVRQIHKENEWKENNK